MARSVVTMKPLKLMDGVEIVSIAPANGSYDETTKSRSSSSTGYAYADRVMQYLQSHEVKINMHEVLQRTGVTDAVARAMKEIESENEVVGESNKICLQCFKRKTSRIYEYIVKASFNILHID